MTKLVLITDSHFGARGDSQIFSDYFRQFYNEIFFPKVKEEKPDAIIHLGDIFNRRKYTNHNILQQCKEYFFQPLEDLKIPVYMICGNHDIYYRNTTKIHAPGVFLKEFSFNIIDMPVEVKVGDTDLALVPWIATDNETSSIDFIKNTKALYGFGHASIMTFSMHPGFTNDSGLDPQLFKKFMRFFTGHFHTKSDNGNVFYLGCPYEITWHDANDPKGFHIFNTEKNELTFIKNNMNMFYGITYNDSEKKPELEDLPLKDRYVKVLVQNKINPNWFDQFIKKIEKLEPADVTIVDNDVLFQCSDDEETTSDIPTIIKECSEEVNLADKNGLVNLLLELYQEAMNTTGDL